MSEYSVSGGEPDALPDPRSGSGDETADASLPRWQSAFLAQHRLTPAYLEGAQLWFAPLAAELAMHCDGAKPPALVAVNGSQGSGKTTLCAWLAAALEAEHGLQVVALSLDDFYLTRARRRELASSVHPLFATRGVPGTHDIALLNTTLDALLEHTGERAVAIPRFDKARDDRRPPADWDVVRTRPDLILLEGWCLGAGPQPAAQLLEPVNALESEEDADARWREAVNCALANAFLPLYQRVTHWVMLQAPSFACVYRWRLEQEHKLAASTSGGAPTAKQAVMNDLEVARFIQYYQRLTEVCLATLPDTVDYLYRLDEERRIVSSRPSWGGHP